MTLPKFLFLWVLLSFSVVPSQGIEISVQEGQPAVCRILADPEGELVRPALLLDEVENYRTGGLRIEISGHLIFQENFEVNSFDDLHIAGIGFARLEQAHAYNDASPLKLVDCSRVHITGIELAGSGTERPDGAPPQQNGIRLAHCDDVSVSGCQFLSAGPTGTMKHAATILDGCEIISIGDCEIEGTTGGSIISGSGDWPHPSDPPVFIQDPCSGVLVEGNYFVRVATGVVFEDLTSRSQIRGNEIRNHSGHGIVIEDGTYEFVVEDNRCGPGRGAAIVLTLGQTKVWPRDGYLLRNAAEGCNDPTFQFEALFYSVFPTRESFHYGSSENVRVDGEVTFLWY